MYAYANMHAFTTIQSENMKYCSFACLNVLLDKADVLSTGKSGYCI